MFNIIKKLPARLAESITRRVEQDCEDYIYNGAQESTTYSDADGVTVTIDGGDDLGLGTESHTREDKKSTVLYKFLLINGETLRRKAMATLRKVKNYLQRLNEGTLKLGDATVRAYAKA